MRRFLDRLYFGAGVLAAAALAGICVLMLAQAPSPNIEFEMMTWKEVKSAIEAGKTTALVYTGGTEQRGPQNVNGGHTLMGREIAKTIALRLGNAIAMPVLPYTPNNASADLPGTIGLTPEILGSVLERIVEQLESGELSLEDSLAAFEKGVGLTKYCYQKLDEVEKKIELLVKDKDGKLRLKPFEELPGQEDD